MTAAAGSWIHDRSADACTSADILFDSLFESLNAARGIREKFALAVAEYRQTS